MAKKRKEWRAIAYVEVRQEASPLTSVLHSVTAVALRVLKLKVQTSMGSHYDQARDQIKLVTLTNESPRA